MARCGIDELIGSNLKIYGVYISIGLFFPLVCTDVVYFILFFKIRGVTSAKRQTYQCSNLKSKSSSENVQTRLNDQETLRLNDQETLILVHATHQSVCHCPSCRISATNSNNIALLNRQERNSDDSFKMLASFNKKPQNTPGDKYTGKHSRGNEAESRFTDLNSGYEKVTPTDSEDLNIKGQLPQLDIGEHTETEHASHQVNELNKTVNEEIITSTRFNRVNFVIGRKTSDSQKQSINLIGVILLVLNLTVLLPASIKLAAVLGSFNISSTETELLFIFMMNNALLNPWIYTLQSTDFRLAVKDNWLRICKRYC